MAKWSDKYSKYFHTISFSSLALICYILALFLLFYSAFTIFMSQKNATSFLGYILIWRIPVWNHYIRVFCCMRSVWLPDKFNLGLTWQCPQSKCILQSFIKRVICSFVLWVCSWPEIAPSLAVVLNPDLDLHNLGIKGLMYCSVVEAGSIHLFFILNPLHFQWNTLEAIPIHNWRLLNI